jgi:hypothetical protein
MADSRLMCVDIGVGASAERGPEFGQTACVWVCAFALIAVAVITRKRSAHLRIPALLSAQAAFLAIFCLRGN